MKDNVSGGISGPADEVMRRIYRQLDEHPMPGEEPFDVEAGLARLLAWISERNGAPAGEDRDWDAAAAAVPEEWVTAAFRHYSMHGAGLIRNILAGAEPLIRADERARRDAEVAGLREQLRQARAALDGRTLP